MKRALITLLFLAAPWAASAQTSPNPSLGDPRLQTLIYNPTRPARMVAFPGTNLTVMLIPGDQIERVTVSDPSAFEVRATESNDSLTIMPLKPNTSASLVVEAKQRRYEFEVGTSGGLAAFLVQFLPFARPAPMPVPMATPMPPPMPPPLQIVQSPVRQYRVSGEKGLRPKAISDDGQRTYIEWNDAQSLPAVFGLGPTGNEEVAGGYIRAGRYTIDRVYTDLVFRIDNKKAQARRLPERKAR
jgi:type IV secretion system protein VirB9